MVLEQFFGYLLGKRHGAKKAMRELEISLRAKDPATPEEDTKLYSITMNATLALLLSYAKAGTLVWFATRKAPKLLGVPPMSRSLFGCYYVGCASIFASMRHHEFYHGSVVDVLEGGEERMKMELAKMCFFCELMMLYSFSMSVSASQAFELTICFIHRILNNHSTDNLLVEAVKRHFIAENLLSDQHQEQPVFRWRQRNSFVEYTFKERMKECEANNSDDEDEAESSGNTRILKEDSLACILGTPGDNTEISKPPEHRGGGTILTRQELQVHR